MATRGRRPTITAFRPLKGKKHPGLTGEPMPAGRPELPDRFKQREHRDLRAIWDEYVAPAYWLTKVDEPLSLMFVYLMHEYLRNPHKMRPTCARELRFVMTSLGFDPVSRARMGKVDDAFDKYKD